MEKDRAQAATSPTSQRRADEAALLACSVYVDLNPVRAGMDATPETAAQTSAYERIQGRHRNPPRERRLLLVRRCSEFAQHSTPCNPGSTRLVSML